MKKVFVLFSILIIFYGCSSSSKDSKGSVPKRCSECHQVVLDKYHRFSCIRCHKGKSPALTKERAHSGIIYAPASPKYMEYICGPCHKKEINLLKKSLHFTLAGEVNLVREIFGLPQIIDAVHLPAPDNITTTEDLVSDLLRRRCLRCHLFYHGDDYPETRHGLGCSACHLFFENGRLRNHEFVKKPPDQLCLHCHYGNHVGWDYYGLFEHDYPYQFRSPLIEGNPPPRPWGIDFHELSPDIHLKHGMSCLACHKKEEIMGDGKRYRKEIQAIKVQCIDCHKVIDPRSPYHHPKVISRARCSACHAVWSFQDKGFYLILQDDPDWDDWSEFMVQGCSEIEKELISYLTTGQAVAQMSDKFSGKVRQGMWFLAFGWRKFEKVPLGFDEKGRVSVIRPILDIHLSYVNAQDKVIFDDYRPSWLVKNPKMAYRAYSPHTIGRGDTFRSQQVLKMLGLFNELLSDAQK